MDLYEVGEEIPYGITTISLSIIKNNNKEKAKYETQNFMPLNCWIANTFKDIGNVSIIKRYLAVFLKIC